jgi:hypothetical protein
MNVETFKSWLEGFLSGAEDPEKLTKEQWEKVKEKIDSIQEESSNPFPWLPNPYPGTRPWPMPKPPIIWTTKTTDNTTIDCPTSKLPPNYVCRKLGGGGWQQ